MNLKKILVGLVVLMFILFFGLIAVLAVFFISDVEVSPVIDKSPANFDVLEYGAAGDSSYAIYNFRGSGNVTALTYEEAPKTEVVIIDDEQAIDASNLPNLIDDLRSLEEYGYNVSVRNQTTIGNQIYVVPTGAIPSYVLFNLLGNSSNGTIIYIGAKDLVISRGIKQQNWYDALTEGQKERVVFFNGTLNELNQSLKNLILYQEWAVGSNLTKQLSGDGTNTVMLETNDSYIRLIYSLDDMKGFADSERLARIGSILAPDKKSVFPWEVSTLRFALNRTNGTATLNINKDGKTISSEFLRRVTDQNIFVKKLQFNDPGEYVILVEDNDELIASGTLHVKDLDVRFEENYGLTYVFSVSVDGVPVNNEEVYVSLEGSEPNKYFVSNGNVAVNAKLNKGLNVFEFRIFGSTVQYRFENTREGFFDIYLNYGLPGFALVAVIYVVARMSRKPMYRLRFGDSATSIREEILVPLNRTVDSFMKIRQDMNLGNSPITPLEFSISLKRYLTAGADVTEGNVEEILKKLVSKGILESHRDYYQLVGEGDVRKNVLHRIIREKLIECGTMFTYKDDKFITTDYEIGFFGAKFAKKGIVVLDNQSELTDIRKGMSKKELSELNLMQANDKIQFVTIDRLQDVI